MKTRRLVTAAIVLVVLGALVAAWALSQRGTRPTVTATPVATQNLAVTVTASGKLVAPQATSVAAPTNGTLASVAVTDGQQVAAGQLLATLDAAPLDLALTQAQAQAAAARAMPTGTERLNNARAAAIRAADAAVAAARADRQKVEVKAPVAGTVQFTSIALAPGTPPLFETHAGATVTSGVPLFTLVDLGQLRFEAQVDETDIAGVQAGQLTDVLLDAFPGTPLVGKVATLKTAAVATSTGGVAFPVQVAFDAAGLRTLVGMSGDATVHVKEVPGALVVPTQAIVSDGAKRYAWKVANGAVTRTEVTLGATTDTLAQVTHGLVAGDSVATGNLTALTDGMAVHVG